ncbi:MAG: DNA-directed RNA polymerase subunit B, partial [Nanoarchaeota archaeon]|nr:DNA-directed RNA polymerase subunit B [Nanoarchaeota archaeon]
MAEIYLNSKYVGIVDDVKSFVESVKDLRREGALSEQVNVYYDSDSEEVHVSADEGRARRPLIVVKGGRPLLSEKQVKQLTDGEITWHDLIRQGVVEYLDAGEEENALVAYAEEELTLEHTHLEITPGSISGITAALVPFGNYNQSSRLIIGSKNQKQALGFYAANYHLRMDMDANVLHYPQFPIVKTKIHDI